MTWTKLGDEFADECWELTDQAFRLHAEGLLWSNRKATDGRLAKEDMRRWAKNPDAAADLVARGWWNDHGDHYEIVHHLGYQRTAEEIAHQSKVNRANRSKGKARPVRSKDEPSREPFDESSDEPSDERDRTGQARRRTGSARKNGADPYTPTVAQLRRIDAIVRDGYDR